MSTSTNSPEADEQDDREEVLREALAIADESKPVIERMLESVEADQE